MKRRDRWSGGGKGAEEGDGYSDDWAFSPSSRTRRAPSFSAFAAPTQTPSAADAAPAIGDFSWHELLTTDWPGALAFPRRSSAGEETESMDMGPRWQIPCMAGKAERWEACSTSRSRAQEHRRAGWLI
jgi:hypothetical protein